MKSIPINSIRPLLVPDGALFLDQDYILLTPDIPVPQSLIERLVRWKFTSILVDESQKPNESGLAQNLSEGDVTLEFLDDSNAENRERAEVQTLYVGFLERLQRSFDEFIKGTALRVDDFLEQSKLIHEALRKHPRFLLQTTTLNRNGFPYLTCHSVNTAILSMAVSENLKIPVERILEIGMAGLLHEIGMLHKTFSKLQSLDRSLTPEEVKALHAHPILSFKILKENKFPQHTCLAVLGHHEKENGSGYPQGLQGKDIPTMAKIVAPVSVYDALVSSRPFRPSLDPYTAMLSLIKEMKITYDETVIRHMIAVIGLIPLGTVIEFKNKAFGQVHKLTGEPKKPSVKVLTGPNNTPLQRPHLVTLGQSPEWEMAKALSAEEIQLLKSRGILPS